MSTKSRKVRHAKGNRLRNTRLKSHKELKLITNKFVRPYEHIPTCHIEPLQSQYALFAVYERAKIVKSSSRFFSDVSFKRLIDIVSEFKCARSHRSNLEFVPLFERCVGYVIIQLDANRVISGRLERSDRAASVKMQSVSPLVLCYYK